MAEPLMIRCRENGRPGNPGAIKVVDHLGNEFAIPAGKDVVALCRCGASKNKPFCDGSHKTLFFRAPKPRRPNWFEAYFSDSSALKRLSGPSLSRTGLVRFETLSFELNVFA